MKDGTIRQELERRAEELRMEREERTEFFLQRARLFERLSWCVAAASVVLAACAVLFLKDPIPMHFNAQGEINGWGSRWLLLVMTAMAVLFALIPTLARKHPQTLNVPVRINSSNEAIVRAIALHMTSALLLAIEGLLLLMMAVQIVIAQGGTGISVNWVLWPMVGLIFLIMAVDTIRIIRER